MEWYHYLLGLGGGILAGVINTMAGNGSAITLSLLIFFGLPGDVANFTNRVGIFAQGVAATGTYYSTGALDVKNGPWVVAWCTLGAIIGALLALQTSAAHMEMIIGILMVVLLGVILVKPKRWLSPSGIPPNPRSPLMILGFLALGFYGGFIQMGMGIFFLAFMVLGAKYNLIQANILKVLVVFIYSGLVLAMFAFIGEIDWYLGGLLAVGQMTGATIAARFVSKNDNAAVWIHRILVFVVIGAIVKLFRLHTFFF